MNLFLKKYSKPGSRAIVEATIFRVRSARTIEFSLHNQRIVFDDDSVNRMQITLQRELAEIDYYAKEDDDEPLGAITLTSDSSKPHLRRRRCLRFK